MSVLKRARIIIRSLCEQYVLFIYLKKANPSVRQPPRLIFALPKLSSLKGLLLKITEPQDGDRHSSRLLYDSQIAHFQLIDHSDYTSCKNTIVDSNSVQV